MEREYRNADEDRLIIERRQRAFKVQPAPSGNPKNLEPKNRIGVALSGGGIRSALYNDGFLQGLSHRGLLRFVDYLSSVSGGGYIAGHLIAQQATPNGQRESAKTPPAFDAPSFHDDTVSDQRDSQQVERWHLGRHPDTGRVEEHRLAGVGGYLSHPMVLLPAYLWATVFSFAFYFGISGVVGTLAAIFWRSFDDPTFRNLYLTAMGIQFGDELLIAFIPWLLLLGLYVLSEVAITVLRVFIGFGDRSLQLAHSRFRTVMLVILMLSIIVSTAVFLGNAKTKVNAGATDFIFLNQFAQALVVIAVLLQLLVFFGSDQLFRSERQEAKSWQKHLQRFISVAVVLLLIFAVVHLMARENISGFADYRDARLILEDIEDWDALEDVFQNIADEREKTRMQAIRSEAKYPAAFWEESANFRNLLPAFLSPSSRWHQILAGRRSELFPESKMMPSTGWEDNEQIGLQWRVERRVLGAIYAYWLTAISGREELSDVADRSQQQAQLAQEGPRKFIQSKLTQTATAAGQAAELTGKANDIGAVVRASWFVLKVLQKYQQELLTLWNTQLQSPEFTLKLLHHALYPQVFHTNVEADSQFEALVEQLEKHWKASTQTVSEADRLTIFNALRKQLSQIKSKTVSNAQRTQQTLTVNRLLLEKFYPDAVRAKAVPSTYVVAPFDQRARESWLGFFLVLSLIGTLTSVYRYRLSAIFRFYRNQLGQNFLRRSTPPYESLSRKPLHSINPAADGLPFPIWQASSLEPTMVNESYQVRTRPFVFSPLTCGDEDEQENRMNCQHLSLQRTNGRAAVSVGDAVTLSGAAVSPLMTNNRCLSLLVDLLNTGLGTQVYRFDGKAEREQADSYRAWGWSGLLALLAATIVWWVTNSWVLFVLTLLLVLLIGVSLIFELGSPHFLRLLFIPRVIQPAAAAKPIASFYVADGGFSDYLGVTSLLRRRCELIIISDAGANVHGDHLGTLGRMCEQAQTDMGVRFLDLDHEAPIDFGRLQQDEKRLVHQPYLCMRVRYPHGEVGLLIYCQMAITDSDPIEIKQIRNKFPSFPDEPTVNQFYTNDQVSAYRALGYHVASKVCREMERWEFIRQPYSNPQTASVRNTPSSTVPHDDVPTTSAATSSLQPTVSASTTADESTSSTISLEPPAPALAPPTNLPNQGVNVPNSFDRAAKYKAALEVGQATAAQGVESVPYFEVIRERLLTAYRLACYEEVSYRQDDIFSEAIWPTTTFAFPNLKMHASKFMESLKSASRVQLAHRSNDCAWLRTYESSGDVRSAYRLAVAADVNAMDAKIDSQCAILLEALADQRKPTDPLYQQLLTSHLVVIAIACQEIHRGRPHAAFQIGGRCKLIELCERIAQGMSLQQDDDSGLDNALDTICSEVNELTRAIFQGGERVSVVSFVQCLALMWGRIIGLHQKSGNSEQVRLRAQLLYADQQDILSESALLDARRELDLGLRENDVARLLRAMRKLWYLGFLRELPITRPAQQGLSVFDVKLLGRHLKELQLHSPVSAMRSWLDVYVAQPGIRASYLNALAKDAEVNTVDSECYLADLLQDLESELAEVERSPSESSLLSMHLAAVTLAIWQKYSTSEKRLESLAELNAKRQRQYLQLIGQLIEVIQATKSNARRDTSLKTKITKLVEIQTQLQRSLSDRGWTDKCSAVLLKCLVALWARRSFAESFNTSAVTKRIHLQSVQAAFLVVGQDQAPHTDFSLATGDHLTLLLSQSQRQALEESLAKIWYGTVLSRDVIEDLLKTLATKAAPQS